MHDDARMKVTGDASTGKDPKKTTRITVTLPLGSYQTVVRMARHRKVSTSWIVRDAVEKYLAADVPLLSHLRWPG